MTQDIELSADKYVQHISRKIMGCNILAKETVQFPWYVLSKICTYVLNFFRLKVKVINAK